MRANQSNTCSKCARFVVLTVPLFLLLIRCSCFSHLAETPTGSEDWDSDLIGAVELVQRDISQFCVDSPQWPEDILGLWRELHTAWYALEARHGRELQSEFLPFAVVCSFLSLLESALGSGGPQLALSNTCPTLLSLYVERAATLCLRVGLPRRARVLFQLGAPLRLMALSRTLLSSVRTRAEKDTETRISRHFHESLQSLRQWGPAEREWRTATRGISGRVEVHSLCDARGENLLNTSSLLSERNHRAWAERWGYVYRMHHETPLEGLEPQFGKIQVALQALEAPDPPQWFLWLDCDALVANRSISLEMLLDTYDLWGNDWVVAEEPSGINSGVFLLRGTPAALEFLRGVTASTWRIVWDQSMFFVRMLEDSDVFAREACQAEELSESLADFQWASYMRTVHQRAMNLYTQGSADTWGASAWAPGDFVVHFAGCPLVEPMCWRRFLDHITWIDEHDR